jgi:hypothetical protein
MELPTLGIEGVGHGCFTRRITKYPRTPHLFDSRDTDDDKHLGPRESAAFLADASLIRKSDRDFIEDRKPVVIKIMLTNVTPKQ